MKIARVLATCAVASVLSASQVSVHVFSLYRPQTILISSASDLDCEGLHLRAGRTYRLTNAIRCSATAEMRLEIPGVISREFRGQLAVSRTAGVLSAVVRMDLETAVAAVVAAEMPNSAPPEALKAVAVLARSFYLSDGRRHSGYDFCDTTHCQFHRAPPPQDHPATRAAADTRNIVTSYRGRRIAPVYSASCGGQTFTAEDVSMGGGDYPYARVSCERCKRSEPSWVREVPVAEAADLVRTRSEAARLALARKLGWSALPGNNYRVREVGNVVVFSGRGQGHGVGLCQKGAVFLATEGADFRQILRHYLPDISLESVRD